MWVRHDLEYNGIWPYLPTTRLPNFWNRNCGGINLAITARCCGYLCCYNLRISECSNIEYVIVLCERVGLWFLIFYSNIFVLIVVIGFIMLIPNIILLVIMLIISWPVYLYFIWFKYQSYTSQILIIQKKILYSVIVSLCVSSLLLVFVLLFLVLRVVLYYVIFLYINYWMMYVGFLLLIVICYRFVGNYILLLSLLPILTFFIKQVLIVLVLIIKVIFYI